MAKTPEIDLRDSLTGNNVIINGNFDFWQRGTSGTGAVYVADRWKTDQANVTQSRSTDVPNSYSKYSLQVSASSGTSATAQLVESINASNLVGKRVTLCFYAKSSTGTPTLNFDIRYANSEDVFSSTTIVQTSSVTLSTTWTKYSFTFNALSASFVNGLALFFYNASTQTFLLSQVYLVAGEDTGQLFSLAGGNFGNELALCQRYFEMYSDLHPSLFSGNNFQRCIMQNYITNSIYVLGSTYKVKKRVSATITVYSKTGVINTISDDATTRTVIATYGSESAFCRAVLSPAVTSANVFYTWTADAEL